MRISLRDLAVPILGAPMAGGPSTPALAAAVSNAGGLGFIPAGYLSAEKFADAIATTRSLTSSPIGVNIFVPQPSAATADTLDRYRELLAPLADRYGAEVGQPHPDDDAWQAKLDVIADTAPEVATFTFGCPSAEVLARLGDRGVFTAVTVTSLAEAGAAVAAGADALIVQGPEAGGHRGTFDPVAAPGVAPLDALLAAIVAVHELPVIAAGGLASADDVRRVLDGGAVAAQAGTAFLLCDEAGTNAVHRGALTDGRFTETVVTQTFSGRYARGLANDFTRRYADVAPLGYPEVNQMTSPLRRAAVAAGDPHGTNLWAGTSWRRIRGGGAGDIVAALAGHHG
ncbi:nitronate monooxygenase [Mycobacterium sp. CVI_P3]|uniref:Propionate 3-nitronate monooxygenase n=1 Tax=Mycobacterium pinniadriaticum TaxID=2994102 RepID=A0ABT3SIH1_9MYCO|nr:nitronate monooxygenase [Mycobacterium pinniadriaticum]MCX2932253.1 nitronate monooxygenase [Mycobacterium pinniadriaticum]MCX2938647.1 nitronate monooxygenase [Mycobacterium pinniadriaticum]